MKQLLRSILSAVLLLGLASPLIAVPTAQTVASFNPFPYGHGLSSNLVLGPDHNYYGTTSQGGAYDSGTVFRLTPAGVLTTLVTFNPSTTGRYPGSLILGTDGSFYGFFSAVAPKSGGIFKLTIDGNLTFFPIPNVYTHGLVQGTDGYLYTSALVHAPNWLFLKISPTTGVVTTLNSYAGAPFLPQYQGQDGFIYGTMMGPQGNVYGFFVTKASTTTGQFSTRAFLQSNQTTPQLMPGPSELIYATTAYSPNTVGATLKTSIVQIAPSGLVLPVVNFPNLTIPYQCFLGSDGNFYGTAYQISPTREATIFKATPSPAPNGSVTTLASRISNISPEFHGLLRSANGDLAWETSYIDSIEQLSGGVTSTLYSFASPNVGYPSGSLLMATDGNFYGMALTGGVAGLGGVYQFTPSGQFTTIAPFSAVESPLGLTQGGDGKIYGITDNYGNFGGTFFVVSNGAVTPLYTFIGSSYLSPTPTIGTPNSTLVKGPDGNFYGLTEDGGTYNLGNFYKISTTGAPTILHSLDSTLYTLDASGPPPFPLLLGKDGNFYAATDSAIFKITPAGKTTILVSFPPSAIFSPTSLVQGLDGNLYGTSLTGGNNATGGTFFRVTPQGAMSILYSFGPNLLTSPQQTTAYPNAMVCGNDGNFYATIEGVLPNTSPDTLARGIVQLTPTGMATLIPYGATQGDMPNSIVQGSDGTLYGTTFLGGPVQKGTIFNVNPGLLDGTIIGTTGSYSYQPGNTIAKAFDGDLTTYFDAPAPGNNDWVGLDLGSVQPITAIAYVPRKSFESRMLGGVFQGSNTADFSSGVVNLAPPIKNFPSDRFNTIPVNGSFRYVRYLSPPGGYGNIGELQFFSGPPTASP